MVESIVGFKISTNECQWHGPFAKQTRDAFYRNIDRKGDTTKVYETIIMDIHEMNTIAGAETTN